MRKTKIICTLGPRTMEGDILEQLIEKGMDVARFNFSHDSHEQHLEKLKKVRELADKHQRPVACLLDTKGPEIRIREFKNGSIELKAGQTFTLTTREVEGTEEIVGITYSNLPYDLEAGSKVLIDDGLIEMKVLRIEHGSDIVCEVLNGGKISNKKGINVPGTKLSMPFISEQDRKDIVFGLENDFDFIAASFVRTADDILQIRKILKDNNNSSMKIIAKIENMQGVENIDSIIEVSDGIMVARGDMGVEIPGEEVPVIQKMIIKKAQHAGKDVITATQMLDSMIKNPRPTRAETADVANAIYDGTGAIMLSGETAAGNYPVEAFTTMARIAERIEKDIDYKKRFFALDDIKTEGTSDAICHAAVTTAHDLNCKANIIVTKTGSSARRVSRFRPDPYIIACTTSMKVCRQLMISWGITPILIGEASDIFELFDEAIQKAKETGIVVDGDIVTLTAGVPLGIPGLTNMIRVETVGSQTEQ